MATTLIDFTGRRFGRLLVLHRYSLVGNGRPRWLCLCDCGTKKIIMGDDLRKPDRMATRSCGCLQKERMAAHAAFCKGKPSYHRKHGATGTAEYKIWAKMRDRCRNPNHKEFHRYGGRGIKVCDRWNEFSNFLLDMGKRPHTLLTLDRIDNNGNYEPGNCRWATRLEQARNRGY